MLPYIHVLSREIPMYGIMAGVGVLLAVLYLKHAEKRCPELEADVELAFRLWHSRGLCGREASVFSHGFP